MADYQHLQEKLGYSFGDRSILIQSLTHTSYGHENLTHFPVSRRNNERLEFLGDSILGVIVSDILLEIFPNAAEGQLSKMRAALVNERTLDQVAREIELSQHILLGKGEELTGGRNKSSITSCTMEALIAAIYLDGGFNAVYPVVRHLFADFLDLEKEDGFIAFQDHKTRLQELVQAKRRQTPRYFLVSTQGPDHAKIFEVEVRLDGKPIARAIGSSKKEAEQNSAKIAIEMVMDEG